MAASKETTVETRKVAGAEWPSPFAAVVTGLTSTTGLAIAVGLGTVSQCPFATA